MSCAVSTRLGELGSRASGVMWAAQAQVAGMPPFRHLATPGTCRFGHLPAGGPLSARSSHTRSRGSAKACQCRRAGAPVDDS
jgi:hypothetical protein